MFVSHKRTAIRPGQAQFIYINKSLKKILSTLTQKLNIHKEKNL